jgi:dTDP-4-amino-4,6-dideoxygalactose transaminase
MTIPFLNPGAQFPSLQREIMTAVEAVLQDGRYILGPEVSRFEAEIAAACGTRHGIGVNSGSDALTVALKGLGVGPGDEVITSPFTYIAPAESIHQLGAKVVFADIHPRQFTIDPADVARRITPRTKAILPVHLFGQAAPLRELGQFGMPLVEDCAQAIGATLEGASLGGIGTVGCLSFYPTKNLGACGDGGMVLTSNDELAAKFRMLRVHGIEKRYHHEIHGFNTRLDELQAAILRVKLKKLNDWNERRKSIAARYDAGLEGLPMQRPEIRPGNSHVYHVYAVLANDRDLLQAHLADRGVPTIIYYPLPLHLQGCYRDEGWKQGDFPVTEQVSRNILPLPMYPELTDEQVDYVIQQIRSYYGA